MKYILNAERLVDIILCEPITKKGKRGLERLGLSENDITEDFFYDNLYVSSKYNGHYVSEGKDNEEDVDDEAEVEYFNEIKDAYEDFEERITSDKQNHSPLLIIGVAGNGKSIEINHVLREITNCEYNIQEETIDFDDSPSSTLTFVEEFPIPDQDDVLWVFCAKLMECIMRFIIKNEDKCIDIRNNFMEDIYSYQTTDAHEKLFKAIGAHTHNNRETIRDIFLQLIQFIKKEGPINGMRSLLKILLWLMYCSDPYKRNYIVFDNIENYIFLDEQRIQILDEDIRDICTSIRAVTDQVIREFNEGMGGIQKENTLGWKRFKVIIVARRTSLSVVSKMVLHRPLVRRKNIVDLTGHFKIAEIWENKKKFIWEQRIRDKYVSYDSSSERKIEIADFVINAPVNRKGRSYQDLIAPLMSYGIRRNAYAQARAIVEMYKHLSRKDGYTISYNQFKEICGENYENLHYESAFMVRRALIEEQFRWMISDISARDRWENLGIGHFKIDEKGRIVVRKTMAPLNVVCAPVIYKDNQNITLMHRVLSYLSHHPDFSKGISKPVDIMFSTVSLYNVVKDVIVGSREHSEITKDGLMPLARVILALCDMLNDDTKGAPYAILGIKNSEFHRNPTAEKLSEILKRIIDAGEEDSLEGSRYNSIDYGLRLTDAGYSFLTKWFSSFSFMEALYCYPLPPLFYLNRPREIEFVIKKVYTSAVYLRSVYEDEASKFSKDRRNFYDGKYLVKKNDVAKTFRNQMREEHKHYLAHYKEYLVRNYRILGLSSEEFQKVLSVIDEHIKKYEKWRKEILCPICF